MTVVVDTCVWTRFLRRNRERHDPLCTEVKHLVQDDAVQRLGCIRQEILSGARPQSRFEQLKEYLRFYPNLPLDTEDDENAAAVRHGMRILTTDTDFDEFAKLLPIELQTVRGRK